MKQALVSISCITYNHQDFIEECLNGFFIQQCNFDVELVISDDKSTDGTVKVIERCLQRKPDNFTIRFTAHETNMGAAPNFVWCMEQCAGKYIALCEGDDYWTDPHKLQKQMDFLEANEGYSLVCGGYMSVNTVTGEKNVVLKESPDDSMMTDAGFDITIEMFFQDWYTKTLTTVFRTELLDLGELANYRYTSDTQVFYHLLKKGNGYYIRDVLGAYNMHGSGMHSMVSNEKRSLDGFRVANELFAQNRNDTLVRSYYFSSGLALYSIMPKIKYYEFNKIELLFDLIVQIKNFEEIKRLLIAASGKPGRKLIDWLKIKFNLGKK
ncbi:MAG TPA: glycosyltransferase [Saprospiraceae bacterium]|nr:glycosyltransferase [Chitinophagaceae bacterium]HNF49291.1 glycosyltransferase [Chitinophagales bacterium]HNN11825.1 glycosyltransferase [Bacteroidia bacterium]HNN69498.1 glycosyltransferase [Saprospiraceae bacterium]HNJ57326.1 glycosyltransferase [Chitinophagaceae bacterium]